MTSERPSKLIWPHPVFARALSFLLLGLIVYGTTVQAAHAHQRVLSAPDSSTAALDDTGEIENPPGLGCSDCLICQLQHNFSTTVITHRQFDPPAVTTTQVFVQAPIAIGSLTNAPRTGRAPPVTS